MQRITLSFPFALHPGQLPALRVALSEVAGFENTLFHNHLPEADKGQPRLSWDYPLIQYGIHRGRPVVNALGAGVTALLTDLLPRLPEQLVLQGRSYSLTGYQLENGPVAMKHYAQPEAFGLVRWVALNAANYAAWKQADGNEPSRMRILEAALRGHLSVMARVLQPDQAELALEARLVAVDQVKRIRWHGVSLVAFHAVAASRLLPPEGLGLGRSVAFGFGSVCGPDTYYHLLGGKHVMTNQKVH